MRWDAGGYDRRFGFVTDHGFALLDLLDVQPPASVIDVGCGTGTHAAELAARGFHVLGVDLDPDMLARARALHPGVEFLAADVQRLHLDRSFDAALSNAALHWMPDQCAALAGVRRVLRAGGQFVAEMGGRDNVRTVDQALETAVAEYGLEVPAIRKFFPSVEQQSALLEANGFDVEMIQWFPRPTPLPDGQSPADWSLLFRADVWAAVPVAVQTGLAARVDALCGSLRGEGGWFVDYHRVRFVARAR
jgi:trans-aconitate methyltransferase